MAPLVEKIEQHPAQPRGFRNEVGRLHDFGEGGVVLTRRGARQHILTENNAHHVVRVLVIDRHPAVEIPFFMKILGLGHGEMSAQAEGDSPGGHGVTNQFFLQGENVGDHLFFLEIDAAMAPAQAGDGLDLLGRDEKFLVGGFDKAGCRLDDPHRRAEKFHQHVQGIGDEWGEVPAVSDPHRLGKDLGEKEDGDGEHGGKPDKVLFPENGRGAGAGHGGAGGVGHGVQGEDGGDGAVDVVFEAVQDPAGSSPCLAEHFYVADGDRVEGGLEDAAHGRDQDRQGSGEHELGHGIPPGIRSSGLGWGSPYQRHAPRLFK